MDEKRSMLLTIVSVVAVLASSAPAPRGQAQRPGSPPRAADAATSANWLLHNLDLAGSRFSALDQINTSNVKSLTPRWLFQHGVIDGVSNQTTPVIVDGVMYVTDSRGSVYAVDAADGHLLWTYDVTKAIGGGAKAGALRLVVVDTIAAWLCGGDVFPVCGLCVPRACARSRCTRVVV